MKHTEMSFMIVTVLGMVVLFGITDKIGMDHLHFGIQILICAGIGLVIGTIELIVLKLYLKMKKRLVSPV